MTDLESFISELRKLAEKSPPIIVSLPVNCVGYPAGRFLPKALLNYIADCLEGNES
jgi:hypothetical protein